MPINTIEEVLVELQRIIDYCKMNNNPCGYFAVLYYQVTKRVRLGIQQHEFDNNELMEKLDVVFAKRYIDAFWAYTQGQPLSACWRIAFDAGKNSSLIVLQHMIAGINAHINLDLGIAASDTMGNEPLEGIRNLFFQMNHVLADMVDEQKAKMANISSMFKWLMPLANKLDEKLVQFSITIARDGAWEFAKQYHGSAQRSNLVDMRDNNVSLLGTTLIKPGFRLTCLIKTIRFFETGSVAEKMQQLS